MARTASASKLTSAVALGVLGLGALPLAACSAGHPSHPQSFCATFLSRSSAEKVAGGMTVASFASTPAAPSVNPLPLSRFGLAGLGPSCTYTLSDGEKVELDSDLGSAGGVTAALRRALAGVPPTAPRQDVARQVGAMMATLVSLPHGVEVVVQADTSSVFSLLGVGPTARVIALAAADTRLLQEGIT